MPKKKKATPIEPTPTAPRATDSLPLSGKGVEPLRIPDIEKAAKKYETKKEARCQASPDEIAAKKELAALLHQHRDELPTNGDGNRFYRYNGGDEPTDYILEEKLKRRKVGGEDGED